MVPDQPARTFPGLRIPSGSSASLIRRCTARFTGSSSFASQSRLSIPTPCSPVMVPPMASAISRISSNAAFPAAREAGSSGWTMMLGCRFPSPAWAMTPMTTPCLAAAPHRRSGCRHQATAAGATVGDIKQLLSNPGGVDWVYQSHRGRGEYYLSRIVNGWATTPGSPAVACSSGTSTNRGRRPTPPTGTSAGSWSTSWRPTAAATSTVTSTAGTRAMPIREPHATWSSDRAATRRAGCMRVREAVSGSRSAAVDAARHGRGCPRPEGWPEHQPEHQRHRRPPGPPPARPRRSARVHHR